MKRYGAEQKTNLKQKNWFNFEICRISAGNYCEYSSLSETFERFETYK